MRDWTWAVIYDDGTEIHEDQAGTFGAIDIPRVTHVAVYDRNEPSTVYAVTIAEGMRPIFFRRKRKRIINNPGSVPSEYADEQGLLSTLTFATVLGWQKTVNGRNVKSLIWLMYDGSVAVTDRDLDELH